MPQLSRKTGYFEKLHMAEHKGLVESFSLAKIVERNTCTDAGKDMMHKAAKGAADALAHFISMLDADAVVKADLKAAANKTADKPQANAPQTKSSTTFAAKLVLPRRPLWIDEREGGRRAAPRVPYSWFLWCWRHKGPPSLYFLGDPAAPGMP